MESNCFQVQSGRHVENVNFLEFEKNIAPGRLRRRPDFRLSKRILYLREIYLAGLDIVTYC